MEAPDTKCRTCGGQNPGFLRFAACASLCNGLTGVFRLRPLTSCAQTPIQANQGYVDVTGDARSGQDKNVHSRTRPAAAVAWESSSLVSPFGARLTYGAFTESCAIWH